MCSKSQFYKILVFEFFITLCYDLHHSNFTKKSLSNYLNDCALLNFEFPKLVTLLAFIEEMKEETIVRHDFHVKTKMQIKLGNRNKFANMLTCILLVSNSFSYASLGVQMLGVQLYVMYIQSSCSN